MDVPIPCICPPNDGVRHPDGDTVTLIDTLDFRTATAIRKCIEYIESDDTPDIPGGGAARGAEVLARLTEGYLLFGISGWSVVDARGKPLPVSHAAIRLNLLTRFDAAGLVADAADELYNKAILLPLLERASRSSPPTSTSDSTSAPTALPKRPPRPSKPSSTSTIQTVDTETTSSSLAGDSSISPRSESAA